MGYPEAVFHLNSIPLLWKSRQVVYISADFPENRIRTIRRESENNQDSKSDDIFNDGIIEYYQNRPKDPQFENMPLVNFAAWYVKKNIGQQEEEKVKEQTVFENNIKLQNNKGYVIKKQKKNIIRLPKLTSGDDPIEKERFCHSKLMTYVPWRQDRLTDILTGFKNYSECYEHYAATIGPLMQEYEKGDADIKKAFEEINEREPDLQENFDDLQEALDKDDIENESPFPMEDELEEFEEEDFHEDSLPTRSNVTETLKDNLSYYEEIRSLNEEQKRIFFLCFKLG